MMMMMMMMMIICEVLTVLLWWRGVGGYAIDVSGQLAAPIFKGKAVHEAFQEAVLVLTLEDGLS